MAANLSINTSIKVKNFLKSFYKQDYFVEKEKRKEGERIFIFTKNQGLSEKLIQNLIQFNPKIKINGDKVGLYLKEWQKFIQSISSENLQDQKQGKTDSSPFKKKNKGKEKSLDIFSKESQSDEAESNNQESQEIEYWKLSKAEFENNPVKEVNIIVEEKERHYILDKNKKGYTVFKDDKAIISATLGRIHEKLICKAYKEGKEINLERVENDYPYFYKKCKKESTTDNLTEKDLTEDNSNQSKDSNEDQFVKGLHKNFQDRKKLNKKDLERIAKLHDIKNITSVFELAEYAWIKWYRNIALNEPDPEIAYKKIVDFYLHVQPTFSLRDSVKVEFQQYSTPAPIAYLAQQFCKVQEAEFIFEPSAGNGLFVFASPYEKTIVNELDRERLDNLKKEPFKEVLNQDAEFPFKDLRRKADAVITNPPFGRLSEKIKVDGYNIKVLDHAMVTIALDTLKDNGRAAIIIGGHTTFTEDGMIRAFRVFFNWLFHHYHVSDIINIEGDLYAKQGTNFDIRLILVDGRKVTEEGFAPMIKDENHPLRMKVTSFEELYDRVMKAIENPEWLFPKDKPIKVVKSRPVKERQEKPEIPLHEMTLYEYAITTPINSYEVKKVTEVDLNKEDWYRFAHKAYYQGDEYYTMAWKLHYDAVSKTLKEGIKVPYEVVRDYPNLLRLYGKRYGITNDEITAPLTFEEWLNCCIVISKGFKETTLFSTLNGEVYTSMNINEWENKYENNERAKEKLLKQQYLKYVMKRNKINQIVENNMLGLLILMKYQLEIALN